MHAREDKHGDTAKRAGGPARASTRPTGLAPPGVPAPAQLSALQGLIGNQSVAQLVRRPGAPAQGGLSVQRAPAGQATATAGPVPLTHGNIQFTNVSLTNQKHMDKATRILDLLSRHRMIQNFLRTSGKPCRIELVQRSGSPAEVKVRGDHVHVDLAHYYFQGYDVSYVMGMLAHEFGIHPLASADRQTEEEETSLMGLPIPVPGLEDENPQGMPPTMNTDNLRQGVGQPHHIMGAAPNTTRHRIYRDVALEMARLLLRDAQTQVRDARPEQVTRLIDCFLMDIASIAATNDNRAAGAAAPGRIAKVYNAYKARLPLAPNDPIRPLLPQDKTPQAVLADFATLASRAAAGWWDRSSIQR